jgi:hypothetical protein
LLHSWLGAASSVARLKRHSHPPFLAVIPLVSAGMNRTLEHFK